MFFLVPAHRVVDGFGISSLIDRKTVFRRFDGNHPIVVRCHVTPLMSAGEVIAETDRDEDVRVVAEHDVGWFARVARLEL